jgi:hypothetical protein
MADTPNNASGPYNPLNVYGNTIDVHYAGTGPKPAGTEKNFGTNKGLEDAIDRLGGTLGKKIDTLGDTIVDKLANHLRGSGGDHGSGNDTGGTHHKSGDRSGNLGDFYVDAKRQQQTLDLLRGKTIDLVKERNELEENHRVTMGEMIRIDRLKFQAYSQALSQVTSALTDFRTALVDNIASFTSGQFAIRYFTEQMEIATEANKRMMGSFTDMLENIYNFGPSYKNTLDAIVDNLEKGGNAYAASGLSLREFGEALRSQREGLNRQTDANTYLDARGQNKLILGAFEQLLRQGIVKDIKDKRVTDLAAKQLEQLKQISKATGKSLEVLLEAQKEKIASIDEALARGNLTETQAQKARDIYQMLVDSGAPEAVIQGFLGSIAHGDPGLAMKDYAKDLYPFGLDRTVTDAWKGIYSDEPVPDLMSRIGSQGEEYQRRTDPQGRTAAIVLGIGSNIMWFLQNLRMKKSATGDSEDKKAGPDTVVESFLGDINAWLVNYGEAFKGVAAVISGLIGGGWAAMMLASSVSSAISNAIVANRANGLLGLLANGKYWQIGGAVLSKTLGFAGWAAAIYKAIEMFSFTKEEKTNWGDDWIGQITQVFSALVPVFVGLGAILLGGSFAVAGLLAGFVALADWFMGGTLTKSIGDLLNSLLKMLDTAMSWVSKNVSDFFWGESKPTPKKPAPPKPAPAPRAPEVAPKQPVTPVSQTRMGKSKKTEGETILEMLANIERYLSQIQKNTIAQKNYNSL